MRRRRAPVAAFGSRLTYFMSVPEKPRMSHWPLRFTHAAPTAICCSTLSPEVLKSAM
jgi:hypothetical protein